MINQDAFLSMIELEKGETKEYLNFIAKNGVYLIVIEGEILISGEPLNKRDAIGISGINKFTFETKSKCKLLFIEVPMN